MAQVFMVTAAELDHLVESIELAKLRLKEDNPTTKEFALRDLHRQMHYQVVRWVQDVAGHKGR